MIRATQPTPGEDVAAEARYWFVRLLDEDASAELVAEWEAWLFSRPENLDAYNAVAEAWAVTAAAAVGLPLLEERERDFYDGKVTVARWRQRKPDLLLIGGGLAAALVLVVSGIFLEPPGRGQAYDAISTQRAEHKAAQLADGSHVQVGAASKLEVRFSRKRRDLELLQGEAMFNVSHDKTRPFVVRTPFGAVTAVGTAFDVVVSKERLLVMVTEGVVALGDPADPGGRVINVRAGERASINRYGEWIVGERSIRSSASWRDGRLEYKDELLSTVIADVNRYASRQIRVDDRDIADLRYTGTVLLRAADSWQEGLEYTFPVVVRHLPNGDVTVEKKSDDGLQLSARRAS